MSQNEQSHKLINEPSQARFLAGFVTSPSYPAGATKLSVCFAPELSASTSTNAFSLHFFNHSPEARHIGEAGNIAAGHPQMHFAAIASIFHPL
jgi:hypothetical protein